MVAVMPTPKALHAPPAPRAPSQSQKPSPRPRLAPAPLLPSRSPATAARDQTQPATMPRARAPLLKSLPRRSIQPAPGLAQAPPSENQSPGGRPPDAANRQPPNRGDWQCWRLNEQDPARARTFRAYTTSPAFALKIRKILPLMGGIGAFVGCRVDCNKM